ncbi:hypothetical protein L2E82_49958 [Cichorium intybus]|nr:hypothetical protein L2E82_49958 [Cichorium intybus]
MEAAMAATDLNGNRRRQPPPELLSDFLVAGGGREYHIWSDFAFGTDYKLQFLHWNRKLKVKDDHKVTKMAKGSHLKV